MACLWDAMQTSLRCIYGWGKLFFYRWWIEGGPLSLGDQLVCRCGLSQTQGSTYLPSQLRFSLLVLRCPICPAQYNGVLSSGAVVASATIISRCALIPFGVADAIFYASVFQTHKDNFVLVLLQWFLTASITSSNSLVVAVVMSSCILCSTSAVAVVEAVTFFSLL